MNVEPTERLLDENAQPDAPAHPELVTDTSKPMWHAPTVTRIDIKRTMFGGGSFTDGGMPSPG
ncbi:MAG: hypothetical protein HY868_03550 [Chloroflexi bacterium]|nr:hypothetical protein [Chloroflexota bacterium]